LLQLDTRLLVCVQEQGPHFHPNVSLGKPIEDPIIYGVENARILEVYGEK